MHAFMQCIHALVHSSMCSTVHAFQPFHPLHACIHAMYSCIGAFINVFNRSRIPTVSSTSCMHSCNVFMHWCIHQCVQPFTHSNRFIHFMHASMQCIHALVHSSMCSTVHAFQPFHPLHAL